MTRPPSQPTLVDYDALVAQFLARDEAIAAERGVSLDQHLADEEARRTEEERRAARAEAIDRRLRNLQPIESRLTAIVHQALVRGERLMDTRALREVYAWLSDPDAQPLCVLTGVSHTGKTVAVGFGLARFEASDYVHSLHIDRRVRPYHGDIERGVVPVRLDIPFLAVDDVGVETPTARALEAMYTVVDERRGHIRWRGRRIKPRTLITSNLAREATNEGEPCLRKHLDPRVWKRLHEDARWVQADEQPVPVWRRS